MYVCMDFLAYKLLRTFWDCKYGHFLINVISLLSPLLKICYDGNDVYETWDYWSYDMPYIFYHWYIENFFILHSDFPMGCVMVTMKNFRNWAPYFWGFLACKNDVSLITGLCSTQSLLTVQHGITKSCVIGRV